MNFAVDTSTVYIHALKNWDDLVVWNYKIPSSSTNPTHISGFYGTRVKKSGSFIVNAWNLETLNLASGERLNPTMQRDTPDAWLLTLEDSMLCYCENTRYYSKPYNAFLYRYDISHDVPDSLALPIERLRSGNGSIAFTDILLHRNSLYILVRQTDSRPEGVHTSADQTTHVTLYRWNLTTDSLEAGPTISSHWSIPWPDIILGVDRWNNIHLLENITDPNEGYLWIFSPTLEPLAQINLMEFFSQHPFIEGNQYIEGHSSLEPFLHGAFDDNHDLFFLADTQKGLFLFRFDYPNPID